HAGRAKESGQALERMDPTKNVVDELCVDGALLQPLVEREEVSPQSVDELLRLAEELVASPVAAVAATATFDHGLDLAAGRLGRPQTLSRSTEQLLARRAQLLRSKRLAEVGIGPEGHAALHVLLRAQGGDDDQRRQSMIFRLADEPNQLEAVDVG